MDKLTTSDASEKFKKYMIETAKKLQKRIVLPEAEEERTLKAADRVLADDIADLILIGNP